MGLNLLPNERPKVRCLAGTEASLGAGATQTFQLMGQFRINEREPLIEREEYTGTLDPWVTAEKGPYDVDGTYSELLTYQGLATHLRYAFGPDPTPVSDAEATPGYTYTYDPCTNLYELDSMEVEHGPPGLIEVATGVRHRQFTISSDSDDAEGAWKWDSQLFVKSNDDKAHLLVGVQTATGGSTTTIVKAAAGWTPDAFIGAYAIMRSGGAINDARLIIDNDATTIIVEPAFTAAVVNTDTFEISAIFTSGIAVPSYDLIRSPGTDVYMDPEGGTIGGTLRENHIISWSITHALGMNPKKYQENERGYSSKVGSDWRRVTGQIRIEHDDWADYEDFKNTAKHLLRFQRVGPVIDAGAGTNHRATIDVFAAYWNEVTRDSDRNTNLTRVYAFKGFRDPVEESVGQIAVKTTLATLP